MAILEAMAIQLPVIISDRCHFPEVESVWNAGVVISPDQDSLTDGIERMLSHSDEELKDMGIRGRQAIIDHYDWSSIAKRLEETYQTN